MTPIFLSRPYSYQKTIPSLFNVWPFKEIYTNFSRKDGHRSNKGNSKFLLKKKHRFAHSYVFLDLGGKTRMFYTPSTMKITLLGLRLVYFCFDSDIIKHYLMQESVGLKSSIRYLSVKPENSSKKFYGIGNVRVMLVARLNININQASGES